MVRPSSFGIVQSGTKEVRYGCAAKQRDVVMIAPIVTLVFLSVLWAATVVFAEIFARSGSHIVAALRGETPVPSGMSLVIRSRPSRARVLRHQPMRARPQLRAAA